MHMFKSLAVTLAAFGTAVFATTDSQLASEIKQITDLAAAIEAQQGGVRARSAPSDNAQLAAEIKQITDLAAAIDAQGVQARSIGPSDAEIAALARQINGGSGAPLARRGDSASSGMPSRAEIDALAQQISQLSARADEHTALVAARAAANDMPSRAEIDELSRQLNQIASAAGNQRRDLPPRLAARADQVQARGIGSFFKKAFGTVTKFVGGFLGLGRR
ncbi:hypothetical protein GGTG_11810 [Gaeumannomyces tritici R3-111a-1]|uniref:Uncharacterized protein n=1 Tax=Gaeumannomyces tritici (strain R3-111a-1) TaxID=644352 RepID=J3PE87_GAET3|nr:hypothetical protein GGTG_11810 [Gaeumannomyces tritici R3-111a-1]EJT70787.1 hypothetical protein GGTG_11810 [Gaeumannomyces tritici R3-111a-1]